MGVAIARGHRSPRVGSFANIKRNPAGDGCQARDLPIAEQSLRPVSLDHAPERKVIAESEIYSLPAKIRASVPIGAVIARRRPRLGTAIGFPALQIIG